MNRVHNALINNACNNQLDKLKENLSQLVNFDCHQYNQKNQKKNNLHLESMLLDHAISFNSKDVAEYLIPLGAKSNYINCLCECKYDTLKDVYELIQHLESKFGSFLEVGQYNINKDFVISRLIDPTKVMDNKERLVYTIELIRCGFLNPEDVKKISNELYSKKELYQHLFKMLSRELFLNELGI